ncbi:DNA-directed RNA polymerases I, II, and III subunit RPABC4 [Candida viswanathii]|uniref:DNA-directed RNA polymerases I, II, and III subunit RPABC4 n=1 Tax=Candida viswanathii TaxID=5486 RepID=A0A367YEI9_9ASCO|nr:DNA-directed RNA polymerases I, II, and III subunit RPABC4 [Candida viswanathii]RCK64268.1 DNA-directed RNA polymerases I, II, and III subunit RPABC4 [Candida viswanathii]
MASPQREGFTIPSSISHAAQGQVQNKSLGVKYNCAQCGASFSLSKSDAIRCKECGHRVIYKARTRRMVQFEAR